VSAGRGEWVGGWVGGWVYPCKLLREATSRCEEVGSTSALDVFKNRAPIVVLSQQQERLLLLLLLLLLSVQLEPTAAREVGLRCAGQVIAASPQAKSLYHGTISKNELVPRVATAIMAYVLGFYIT
jgi:hypothetical protein